MRSMEERAMYIDENVKRPPADYEDKEGWRQRWGYFWPAVENLCHLNILVGGVEDAALQLEKAAGWTFYSEWKNSRSVRTDGEPQYKFRMTEEEISLCRQLTGPHAYTIYKAMLAKREAADDPR